MHKVWNENTAVLSGEPCRYWLICKCPKLLVFVEKKSSIFFQKQLWKFVRGNNMIWSLKVGMTFRKKEYLEMIRLKTAVLLGGALKIGAVIAEAHPLMPTVCIGSVRISDWHFS